MRVGAYIFLTDQTIEPARLGEALEGAGFESLFVTEHSHIPTSRQTPWGGREGAPPLPEEYWRTLDSFVALGAVASVTDNLRLGTGITLVAQHDPIWLAKQVATLDHISNGRVDFGIGYGWNREEMAHHGVEYRSRRRLVAEKIGLMKALWTQDEASYEGELVRLEPSWAWPKPIQDPHPPILMGSGIGPRTIAAILDYCDGWIPIAGRYDLADSMARFTAGVSDLGRDPANYPITVFGAPNDPSELQRLAEMGVSRVLVRLPSRGPDKVLRLIEEHRSLLDS